VSPPPRRPRGGSAAAAAHAVHNPVRIRIVSRAADARRLVRGGSCALECSFGSESVVCPLELDHHGSRHELPGVAIRAYGELFGARRDRPWFVVTGAPDEDLTWALGSLAGLLPHPSRGAEFASAPEPMRGIWTRDWTPLVELINRVDTDPAGVDLARSDEGRMILLWRLRSSLPLRDVSAFHAGLDRWRALLVHATEEDLARAPWVLRRRLATIRGLPHESFGRVTLIDSSIWGYSATYAREWHEIHRSPLLFVFQPRSSGRGVVTVSAVDRAAAESLYGAGGLLNLLPRLAPRGWGGRPLIGGSARGRPITWDQARAAARLAARLAG